MTGLDGLPLYLDLAQVARLREMLRRLQGLHAQLISFLHSRSGGVDSATLDMDATLIETHKETADYQWDLLRYCAEGRDRRFGVIEFAVSCDVTEDFKHEVAEVSEADWHPLWQTVDGRRQATGQQWAEVCFVPSGAGFKKHGPEYRYLAIREALPQMELPDGLVASWWRTMVRLPIETG